MIAASCRIGVCQVFGNSERGGHGGSDGNGSFAGPVSARRVSKSSWCKEQRSACYD